MRAVAAAVACALLVLGATLGPPPSHAQRDAGLAVVAHPSCGVTELSGAELEAIFTSSMRRWPNGRTIVPFNYPPDHVLRRSFDRQVLRLTPSGVSRFWINQRIRGGARPPRQVSDVRLMTRVLPRLAGSVGYVPGSSIPPGTRVVCRVQSGRVLAP